MTGAREVFTELDMGIRGSVRFGDGSTAAIEGQGTILFTMKTGEHQRLSEVYFIPRLTTNIVSIGQLGEGSCKVHIDEGVLRILDQHQRLVARVLRSPGRLYLLQLMVVKLVCRLAQRGDTA